ncbi:hypothetical protein ATEIFO6365_0008052100 [Aspergillus terreus]|uniref:Uncharacterized protein n=1 Tax=Aspergillus terreus TaxID=33178 RepID=A0A5M3ZB98_ASPTE|nr:hypothetical protein ATETN484_0010053000 [Aspergillus terreus]GFF18577.1 hypothetical protein ATEIFO6365_0008052100 [Aspergillus terreus]
MKLSLLLLSTLAAGVLAVAPGGGEDANHNSSKDVTMPLKDIPLTPDEPGYKPEDEAKDEPTKASSSASPSSTLATSKAPKKTDDESLVGKLMKDLPVPGDILGGL